MSIVRMKGAIIKVVNLFTKHRLVSSVDGLYLRSGMQEQCVRHLQEGRDYGAHYDGLKVKGANEEVEEPLKLLQYLDSLRNFEKEGMPKGAGTECDAGFDLKRMSRLLFHLGDPLSKYKVVHVAGTKGKGSTVAFLSNILRAAGFRVGSYTSPHIRSIRERIVCGATGQPISPRAFNQLFDDLHKKINDAVIAESRELTHFEVLTALAFAHFAREKVDIAIIEAGLGGVCDATNVIQAPGLLAAVIVGIGEEHLEALGGSLESIALAKAGIIKDGRPVILGRQTEPLAENVVRQVAASKSADVLPPLGLNNIWNLKGISTDGINPHQFCDISINCNHRGGGGAEVWKIENLRIPTLGAHQLDNATAAIQTALCLRKEGWKVSNLAIRLGVESTVLPGRFQFATPAEAKELDVHGSTVILDGAHTEGSAKALAHTLKEVFPNDCLAMVVAMASDKDHLGFARAVLKDTNIKIIVTTRVDIAGSYTRSTPEGTLAEKFVHAGQELNMTTLTGFRTGLDSRSAREVSTSMLGVESRTILQSEKGTVIVQQVGAINLAITTAARLIKELNGSKPGVICITGSLHAVGATIQQLNNCASL